MFSGADSDDVRLAVQHIVRGRPGSSVMGVGWGWGANMLTKYLGEEAGSTSLMAAVAISNPFDLQQSSMYLGMTNAGQLDCVMAKGLVNILKDNKVRRIIFDPSLQFIQRFEHSLNGILGLHV